MIEKYINLDETIDKKPANDYPDIYFSAECEFMHHYLGVLSSWKNSKNSRKTWIVQFKLPSFSWIFGIF